MKLSNQIAAALRRLGMNQTEAAARLGVTKQAISLWLAGERVPRRRYARKLAKVLGIEIGNGQKGRA